MHDANFVDYRGENIFYPGEIKGKIFYKFE
jgi:hypothetical protein